MRKSAGFILVALLLVPALAFAWTTGITVQGPAAGMSSNIVTITSPAKTVSGGTAYVYPTSSQASITANIATGTGYSATVTLNGATLAPTLGTTYTIPQAPLQNLKVVYAAVINNITVTQPVGGKVTISIGNATTAVGFTGVAAGTLVTVKATPNANYGTPVISVTGATLTGNTFPMGSAAVTVSATFASVAYISANLSAPITAVAGTAFTANAQAQSNSASALQYAFNVDGAAFPAASATSTHSYTLAAGTHTLGVQVTDGTVSVTKYTTVTVAAASTANICLGCHASSTPTVVAAFNTGTHNGNGTLYPAKNDCTVCHTATPHSNGGTGSCVGCHSVPQQANGAPGITAPANGFVNDNDGVRAASLEFDKWSHHVTGVTLNDAHCAACHLEGTVVNGKVVVDPAKHMASNEVHLRNADNDSEMTWNPEQPNFSTMDNFCMSCHDNNGATSTISQAIQAFINDNGIAAAGKTASATNPFGDTISNQYDKMERPAVVDAKGQFNAGNNSHHAVMGKRYTGNSRNAGARQIGSPASFAANSSANLPSVASRKTIFDAGRFEATYKTLANYGGETDTVHTLTGRNGGSALGDDSTLHCGDCHTVGQFAKRGSAAFGNLSTTFGAGITRYNKVAIGAHGSANEYLLRNNIGTDARHIGAQFDTAGTVINNGTQPYLVCVNCHLAATYLGSAAHVGEKTGAGEYCNGPFNTRAEPNGAASKFVPATYYTGIGEDRLMSVVTTNVPGFAGGAYGAQTTGHGGMLGNIYGIQCANCHNSGPANGFGGIHGSKVQTYVDGMGNTTKAMRFLPGLGNVMYVAGTKGGVTGGTDATYKAYSSNRLAAPNTAYSLLSVRNVVTTGTKAGSYTYKTGGTTNDANWEQKSYLTNGDLAGGQANAMGCYTLTAGAPVVNALAANGYPADDVRYAASKGMEGVDGKELLDNWGGCEDHGSVQGGADHRQTRGVIRPVSY